MTQIKTAMVLAAGLGTRMGGGPDAPPKPLTMLAGRTLLDRMIDKLYAAGVEKIIVNVHHKAAQIETHLAGREDIYISDEREGLMDTGGGVKKALPLLGNAPFMVCNGDVFWHDHHALVDMGAAFDAEKMDALLLLAGRDKATGYDGQGDFMCADNGRLTRTTPAPYIYAGAQIVTPELVAGGPNGAFSFTALWDKGRIYGHKMGGWWAHIGTPQGLAAAEAILAQQA